jgi:hypothetical protein
MIIDFALDHPGLVHALVLVGSAVSGFEGGGDPRISGMSWLRLTTLGTAGRFPS